MSSPPGTALLVVHALPPAEASGTPLAAAGYARELAARGWLVVVATADPAAPPWSALRVTRRAGEDFFRLPLRPVSYRGLPWPLDAPLQPAAAVPPPLGADGADLAACLWAVFGRLRPDVVHIVDTVDLPLAVGEIAHRAGIPVVRTVACAEDLCARIAPVSPRSGPSGFCPAPITPERCAACLAASADPAWARFAAGSAPGVERRRRAEAEGLLRAKRTRTVASFDEVYDRVVFASAAFRAYFEQTLPLDPARTAVVPMGVDLPSGPPVGPAGTPAAADPSEPLRFVLAANADPAKGVAAVVDAFLHPDLARRDDWRLVLAGGGERRAFGPLGTDPRVTDRGPYAPAELAGILAAADVGLSTSVFETFHRVTREYLAAGLAVVGSTAFGIGDVVTDGYNGLIFDHADPGSLRRALLRLLDDRTLAAQLRRGALATPIRTVAEEVDDLVALYDEVRTEARRPGARRRRWPSLWVPAPAP